MCLFFLNLKMILGIVFCVFIVSEEVIGSFGTCIHGGMKYKDGEYFPPNNTVIKTEGPQQCVQCRCHNGLVVCEIENCPVLNCETSVKHPRYCCRKCPEVSKLNQEPSELIFGTTNVNNLPKKKPNSDCVSNENYFADGTVWQPVIGPFGRMACVQCRCQEGNIICSRLKCKDLPCSYPRQEFGECCPTCPFSEKNKKSGTSCLPKTSEIFVFKTPNVQNNSEKIQYGFVENTEKDSGAMVHTWNLDLTRFSGQLTLKMVTLEEFREMDLIVLGSVSRKRLKKYTKRESKLGGNCSGNCLKKIERLENSLRVFSPNSRSKCSKDEIDVVDI